MIDVPDMNPVFFPVVDKKELQQGSHNGQIVQLDKHASLNFLIEADFRYQENKGINNHHNIGHGNNQTVYQGEPEKTFPANGIELFWILLLPSFLLKETFVW